MLLIFFREWDTLFFFFVRCIFCRLYAHRKIEMFLVWQRQMNKTRRGRGVCVCVHVCVCMCVCVRVMWETFFFFFYTTTFFPRRQLVWFWANAMPRAEQLFINWALSCHPVGQSQYERRSNLDFFLVAGAGRDPSGPLRFSRNAILLQLWDDLE